jgi:hypothetical protein
MCAVVNRLCYAFDMNTYMQWVWWCVQDTIRDHHTSTSQLSRGYPEYTTTPTASNCKQQTHPLIREDVT